MQHDPDTLATASTASTSSGDGQQLKIFINYRRDDAAAHARLLYDRLAERFGGENVFLDVVTMEPGVRWLDEIRSQSSRAGVFLALIGPRWAELMSERAGGAEDHVRSEIEAALRASSVEVIPTLLDGAQMPTEQHVPHSLRPLLRRNATVVRLAELDSDVAELARRLEQIAAAGRPTPAEAPVVRPRPSTTPSEIARPPDADHYDEVVRLMLDEASLVVPFLGPGANSSDRDEVWSDLECGYLPDAEELAAYLSRKLELGDDPVDLAQASQYVWELRPSDLYGTLRKTLMANCPPGSAHRFLATFPTRLEKLGLEKRYQLIVTTNYDDALERAFVDENEPYDLAVYMSVRSDLSNGPDGTPHRGKFVHVPHEGEPRVVDKPNEYLEFPVNRFTFGLERTVIVKIHGAVDTDAWRQQLRDHRGRLHRLSEPQPDRVDRAAADPRQAVREPVPLPRVHDARLEPARVPPEDVRPQLPNNSWAIQRDPTRLDGKFWKNMCVDALRSATRGATSTSWRRTWRADEDLD